LNNQKNIVINAATVATGGGLIVAVDIIKALCSNPQYKITLICPEFKIYRKLEIEAQKIFAPKLFLKFYTRWLLDYIWLRRIIIKINPDLVISLGNLPAITPLKQVMFNDNAFVSERNFKGFKLTLRELFAHSIRKWLFHKRLKFVDILMVQTELEKKKFIKNFFKLPPIICLTPLQPSHLTNSEKLFKNLLAKNSSQIRLGCLSYVHGYKNIRILSEVLDIAVKQNFHLQIIFTISPDNSLLSKRLKKILEKHFKLGTAINLGKIKNSQICDLVAQLDGLILPSLNESFSLNYIEAAHCKKPLLISDRPFAREICKDYAFYFDPLSPESIFNTIVEVFKGNDGKSNIGSLTVRNLTHSIHDDLYELINNNS
jgi:glycosyltransferase involved in cell wall biosynthesis